MGVNCVASTGKIAFRIEIHAYEYVLIRDKRTPLLVCVICERNTSAVMSELLGGNR